MDLGILIPLAGIVMGCGIPMVAIWSKQKIKVAEMQVSATAQHTAERAAQYASQVQKLEDRVRVLERIVTDKGYDVATQIEALRDTRTVEIEDSGTPLRFEKREMA
ncbi:hypothetical protein A3736_05895 [Erythrobacter sp. HI0063]|jgi:hypothetical protein|uniref:hypothetical protein n=1 Tax=Erythrobacter sp. HI0063 TaxID=1822240 RepID=UPI0007C34FB4|nr:hypothetical protein [Erythrobacter sp. HI0063]KZY57371.1 hypothetical protein A3736_05895 [Erythrobacter sp. HI0063]|tara:strand:+ start:816 stop:1133 length:318 start_codon:yes stop_codon:yes gene_type:complete